MGKRFSKQGGKQHEQQLLKWNNGKDSLWSFDVSDVEVNRQLLKQKHCVEKQLKDKTEKRRKLESALKTIQSMTKKQAKTLQGYRLVAKERAEDLLQNLGVNTLGSNSITNERT